MLHIWYEYFSVFTLSTPPLSFYFIQLAIRIWLFPSVFRLPSLLLYSIMLRRLLLLLVFLSQYKNKNNKCPKYKRARERGGRSDLARAVRFSKATAPAGKQKCAAVRNDLVRFSSLLFLSTRRVSNWLICFWCLVCHTGFQPLVHKPPFDMDVAYKIAANI